MKQESTSNRRQRRHSGNKNKVHYTKEKQLEMLKKSKKNLKFAILFICLSSALFIFGFIFVIMQSFATLSMLIFFAGIIFTTFSIGYLYLKATKYKEIKSYNPESILNRVKRR